MYTYTEIYLLYVILGKYILMWFLRTFKTNLLLFYYDPSCFRISLPLPSPIKMSFLFCTFLPPKDFHHNIIPFLAPLHTSSQWILFIFLDSGVTLGYVFTSEDLGLGYLNNREHEIFVLLGLSYLIQYDFC